MLLLRDIVLNNCARRGLYASVQPTALDQRAESVGQGRLLRFAVLYVEGTHE